MSTLRTASNVKLVRKAMFCQVYADPQVALIKLTVSVFKITYQIAQNYKK